MKHPTARVVNLSGEVFKTRAEAPGGASERPRRPRVVGARLAGGFRVGPVPGNSEKRIKTRTKMRTYRAKN